MCLFKKTPSEPSPISDYAWISRDEFITILGQVGITPISKDTPLDNRYSIATKTQLDLIAPYLVYPADLYISEIADCEDYAIKAQSDACFK